MKIKFPLKFTTEYRSSLSKDELIKQVNKGESEKIIKGLTTKKYAKELNHYGLKVHRFWLVT